MCWEVHFINSLLNQEQVVLLLSLVASYVLVIWPFSWIISWIMTAKWGKELQENRDRKRTEYVMIGTLISFTFTILYGVFFMEILYGPFSFGACFELVL